MILSYSKQPCMLCQLLVVKCKALWKINPFFLSTPIAPVLTFKGLLNLDPITHPKGLFGTWKYKMRGNLGIYYHCTMYTVRTGIY
jgi:hypothetical protein